MLTKIPPEAKANAKLDHYPKVKTKTHTAQTEAINKLWNY